MSKLRPNVLIFILIVVLFLTACTGAVTSEPTQNGDVDVGVEAATPEYKIVTLLPRDGIPAIDQPVFQTAEEAEAEYDPDDLVIGVSYNGDARAYSVGLLSSHEIVNDTVGGRKIAVTW